AVDYYCDDIINIFYTEARYVIQVTELVRAALGIQYTDQRSVGDELLTGTEFATAQFGVQFETGYAGALLNVGWTHNDAGADLRNPWSGYPGYTSAQVQNFNRA